MKGIYEQELESRYGFNDDEAAFVLSMMKDAHEHRHPVNERRLEV